MLRPYGLASPVVHPSAYIDASAQIIGAVEIGEDSSVWMNAVLRGDVNTIRVGRRSNIQDCAVVHGMRHTHPTRIGDDVTVGHGAVLHGCTVGDRCVIGMGAILLNGVEVGMDSIVAAGSLLPEEMKVPPRSMVMGSPGRVRRELTDDEVASIRGYADRYVEYRQDYRAASPALPDPPDFHS